VWGESRGVSQLGRGSDEKAVKTGREFLSGRDGGDPEESNKRNPGKRKKGDRADQVDLIRTPEGEAR